MRVCAWIVGCVCVSVCVGVELMFAHVCGWVSKCVRVGWVGLLLFHCIPLNCICCLLGLVVAGGNYSPRRT